MAANSKRTSHAPFGATTAPGTEAEDDSGIYLRASRYREELEEEARTLRRAGRIRAAKGVENRVLQVEQLLGALEGEKRVGPVRAHPELMSTGEKQV